MAGKLAETEEKLNRSVSEAAGMQIALIELQSAGTNKDAAVGNALKALEEQWSKQAQTLQQRLSPALKEKLEKLEGMQLQLQVTCDVYM